MGRLRFAVRTAVGVLPLALGASALAAPAAVAGGSSHSCATAGGTGLTAAVVASAGERIEARTINAAGCDLGIYVGPGANQVVIDAVMVTGANDHGIFVQDASQVTIEDSTVSGNGVNPLPTPSKSHPKGIFENKAIELVGTTSSLVRDNTVTGNFADGGIGVADDGPIDPGAPNPGTLRASKGVVVAGNTVAGNYVGCGIVLAAYNKGAGIFNNVVNANTVSGSMVPSKKHGPVVGGIVVAADTPSTTVSNNKVFGNTVTDSFIPGIVVHSNAPGDVVSGNAIVANTFHGDGWGKIDLPIPKTATPFTVGILVAAVAPGASLADTTVAANPITGEDYGIYISGATATKVGGLRLDQATTPVGS